MQRVIDNPTTGERIVIRQSAADTQGELLAFDVFLQPGGHVPAGHVHPRQEERFSVVAGKVRFRVGGRSFVATAGDVVTVQRGTPHWFGNNGSAVAQIHVEVRPALRMQALFEINGCPPDGRGRWAHLLDVLLIPLDFQSELAVPHIPAGLLTTVLRPLAWLRIRLTPPAGT